MRNKIVPILALLLAMPTNIQANDVDLGGMGDVTPWTGANTTKDVGVGDTSTLTAMEITTKDVGVAGTGGSSSAVLNVAPSQLSVTVPMSLPIHLAANGTVTTAKDAKIVNNSIGRVKVTDVDINSANGWSVINYDSDLSTYKVNEKKVGFTLNGIKTSDAGLTFDESRFPSISGKNDTASDELKLDYSAVVTPQANVLTNEEVAKVVFTVDWDSSEEPATEIHMTAEEATAFGYSYTLLADDTYSLTDMPTTVENIQFPSSIGGKSVTKLGFEYGGGNYGNNGNWTLKTVVIPNSVTTIEKNAFEDCTSLESAIIGNGVTSIGRSAFAYCYSLTTATIPDSVTSIGYNAFASTSLTSVAIPEGITEIGERTFEDCTSLTSITIPDSVTSIGNLAFSGCKSLTSVIIPNSVTTIKSSAFSSCTSLTSITIPDSVASIGNYAFFNCENLTSVTIPDSVKSIGEETFSNCKKLKSVVIPDSVTSIGNSAFARCTSLTSIIIPDNVTSIGNSAFSDCTSLTSVTIGNSVTSIGEWAFNGCYNLTKVRIPDSVEIIGNEAFFCIPSIVYSGPAIGSPWGADEHIFDIHMTAQEATDFGYTYEFLSDGTYNITGMPITVENIQFPSTIDGKLVTKLGFDGGDNIDSIYTANTTLRTAIIPHGVTIIGEAAFSGCKKLESITIPESVTTIGDYAFASTGLASVTIPDSVTFIGDYAFNDIKQLDYYGLAAGSPWGALCHNNYCSGPDIEIPVF